MIVACRTALDVVEAAIHGEWTALHALIASAVGSAVRSAERLRLKRLLRTFALGELADRGFLPGYGFPRNIVPFVTLTVNSLRDTNHSDRRNKPRDERSRSDRYPSRDIDLALAEYAPGGEVIVDGLVYKSGGITLNWQRPAGEDKLREIQALSTVWRCPICATLGRDFANACPICAAPVSTGFPRSTS